MEERKLWVCDGPLPSELRAFKRFSGGALYISQLVYDCEYSIEPYKFIAERQMSKYPIEQCHKITELCVRWGYMKNEYPKEAFASAVYRKFEGCDMPIPVGYDAYLKMAFGDYMTVPPKEQQTTCHDAVWIDTKRGYKMYKGIYYGTNGKGK